MNSIWIQSFTKLVSMRSSDDDNYQSRAVRLAKNTEKQIIQYDTEKKPLFSVGKNDCLLLAENGNGDICVADFAGEAVVVVKPSGELRFKYQGNPSKQSEFLPIHIATDTYNQILVNDFSGDNIHILNWNGLILRVLQFPCSGGICVDPEGNLLTGDHFTGEILIIKYLQPIAPNSTMEKKETLMSSEGLWY